MLKSDPIITLMSILKNALHILKSIHEKGQIAMANSHHQKSKLHYTRDQYMKTVAFNNWYELNRLCIHAHIH